MLIQCLWNLSSDRSGCLGEDVETEERGDGGYVEARYGGDLAPKHLQVRLRDSEDGSEDGELVDQLGKPREGDAEENDVRVEFNDVSEPERQGSGDEWVARQDGCHDKRSLPARSPIQRAPPGRPARRGHHGGGTHDEGAETHQPEEERQTGHWESDRSIRRLKDKLI